MIGFTFSSIKRLMKTFMIFELLLNYSMKLDINVYNVFFQSNNKSEYFFGPLKKKKRNLNRFMFHKKSTNSFT